MKQDIIGKALLVRLTISQFNPSKTDRSATTEVLVNKHAAKGSAEVRKLLLPKEATEPIAKLGREIRQDFYRMTLPWDEDGVRLLPTDNWLDFTEMMATHRNRWDNLVREFLNEYQNHRSTAMTRLGLLFDEKDYPNIHDVQDKFGLVTRWNPLPKSDDFRLTLNSEDMEELEADLEDRVQTAVLEANRDLYNRLAEKLGRISKQLGNPDALLRDSLISNVKDLCKLIPNLNVTGDQDLEAIRQQVLNDIASVDMDDIRGDDDIRDRTRSAADDILRKMGINPVAQPETVEVG